VRKGDTDGTRQVTSYTSSGIRMREAKSLKESTKEKRKGGSGRGSILLEESREQPEVAFSVVT